MISFHEFLRKVNTKPTYLKCSLLLINLVCLIPHGLLAFFFVSWVFILGWCEKDQNDCPEDWNIPARIIAVVHTTCTLLGIFAIMTIFCASQRLRQLCLKVTAIFTSISVCATIGYFILAVDGEITLIPVLFFLTYALIAAAGTWLCLYLLLKVEPPSQIYEDHDFQLNETPRADEHEIQTNV